MNILKKYKDALVKIDSGYSKEESMKAMWTANICTLVLAVPVVMVSIELFTVFMMRPYLISTIIYVAFFSLSFVYFLFRTRILLNYRRLEDVSYWTHILIDFLFVFILLTIVFLVCILYVIPKFVL